MQDVLNRVSENCLRGQQVPDDLKRIWNAKLNGNAELLDDVECDLIHEVGEDLLEGYTGEDVDAPSQRAYERMFEHVCFFAVGRDGVLLGYWIGPNLNDIEVAPVVELDNEGQFQFVGSSFADYILGCSEDNFEEMSKWLSSLGIPVTLNSMDEYWKRVEELGETEGDPNDLSWSYQKEEQDGGFGSGEDLDDDDDDEI